MDNLENESLFLSEDKIFYTLEGEGMYVGMPSVFMRLSMCNLTCKGFASPDSPHGCDSYISWSVKNKTSFKEIDEYMVDSGFNLRLKQNAIFKITGGEPFIQEKKLLKFIQYFEYKNGFVPIIDFETNGALIPSDEWKELKATFTVSPKLASNGDPEEKRYNPDALKWHADSGRSFFKFVVQSENDIDEIVEKYINKFYLDNKNIWFMPCCGSREEHTEKATQVAEWAKQWGVNFSPRLHLVLWNKALKV
jgi:organic radical activating enzyme